MKGPWDTNWAVEQQNFGKGGQGITHVVRRRDDSTQKAVLKVLKNNKNAQARGRMHREVESLRTLHLTAAKVPSVLEHNTDEFDDAGVQLYVVMEYVDGRTLAEIVAESNGVTLEKAVAITQEICKTMAVCHENDVLHRDLKPQNIVVADDSDSLEVTILDYGLSFNRADDEEGLTTMNETFANKFFNLPETNTPGSDHRDPRSDITAACGILYYCLTGEIPGQLRDGNNVPPHKRDGRSVRDKLPGDYRVRQLDMLFDRAFSPDLDSRFQLMCELLEKLDSVLVGPTRAPQDPVAVAALATEVLTSGADRKAVIAEFKVKCDVCVASLSDYVKKLRSRMSSGSIVVETTTFFGGVQPPKESQEIGVPPFMLTVAAKHHDFKRILRYHFAVRGNRCYLLRSETTLESQGPLAFQEGHEVMSFERSEEPNPEAAIEDLERNTSKAIEFVVHRITGHRLVD